MMNESISTRVGVLAAIAATAVASHAGGIELQPGDLLVSARNPLFLRPDVYVIRADGHVVSGGLLTGELIGTPPQLPPATMLEDGAAALSAFSPSNNQMFYFSVFSDGGLEGGPAFTAPLDPGMGIESTIAAQQLFSSASGLQDYGYMAARPSYAVGQHPFRANHPSFFDDPLLGFLDPIFGFEDPLLGFDDPLLGFTASSVTVAYPRLGSLFDLGVTGGSITAAIAYPRAWFIDPTTLDAFDGVDGESLGIFAGFLVLSEDAGGGPGLYLAPLDRPSIENRDVELYQYATSPIFSDPELVIEGMQVDPVIPGQAYLWGINSGRARGVLEPVIYRLNTDRTIEQISLIPGSWDLTEITDLVAAPDGMLYVVDSQDSGDGQIVRINPSNGDVTVLAQGGSVFIDPHSISVVVEPIPTFTVNTTDDLVDPVPGDGIVNNGFQRSLRAAIMEANAMSGAVNIVVPAGTYTLTQETSLNTPYGDEFHDLDIAGDIRIVGAGAGQTIIDGNELDRVMQVHPDSNLLIQGVTIRNGFYTGSGGGIRVDMGSITVLHCELTENRGAGILIYESQADIFDTHIHRNNSGTANGGGIATGRSDVVVEGCSIVQNRAWSGGGIVSRFDNLDLINCTISSNDATINGGGIIFENSPGWQARMRNCTVVYNQADTGEDNGVGGGIFSLVFPGDPTPIMQECVIAWNETDWIGVDDINGKMVLGGNNWVYAADNLEGSGDLGGLVTDVDPWVRSQRIKIGNTEVNMPRNNSPIVDAGTPAGKLLSDQVGNARPYDTYGNGVALPDLGAVERQTPNCVADINDTGVLDIFDIFAYLTLYENQHATADITGDGIFDIFDVFAFLAAFEAGCP
ncbi:MAG: right-handed parallel beta-helix repeat-containing protein [Phycisphaerales bacterium]|nr:right-handed parallel beta-helix repeat-containing protein [Phycisphaerales bacterium]